MSIKQTENGQWKVDLQLGFLGKRIRQTFQRKADAVAFESKLRLDHQQAKYLGVVPSQKILFKDLAKVFIERHTMINTRNYHISEMYRINGLVAYFGEYLIQDMDNTVWTDYAQARLKKGISRSTLNRELTVMKSMFNWSMRNNMISKNPLALTQKFKVSDPLIRYLTDEEINRLLKAAKEAGDHGLQLIILVALNTGFRKANLESLRWEDVEEDFILARQTKSGVPYRVPMNAALKNLLKEKKMGLVLDTRNLRFRFESAVKAANLDGVTLHTLRHTFASKYVQQGVSLFAVSKWLGHSSVKMTEKHYAALSPEFHTAEIKKLPSVGKYRHFSDKAFENNGVDGI